MTREEARALVALALDLPLGEAQALYDKVKGEVGVVKVGLSLFVEHGPLAVRPFVDAGAKVFLDLKLHDIPNTVELAAEKAARLGVSFLTVHAQGGPAMLAAARRGAEAGAKAAGLAAPTLLAVTVLTSMDERELGATGHSTTPAALASTLATMAHAAGLRGLVCSPREVAEVRRAFGAGMFVCTPGIRPQGSAHGDQARAETPADAVKAGSNLLVVGRPITQAKEPVTAAKAIVEEIAAAR